jgi:hypothetical protein
VPRGADPAGGEVDLHDAELFGYTPDTENRPGWSDWYGDFLTDHIKNRRSGGNDTGLGLGPDAWARGVPHSHVPLTPGGPLAFPDVSNDSPPYLSDVYWASSKAGSGVVRRDTTVGNNPIRINGAQYAKGVGAHADGEVLVNLGGRSERFQADVGIDDDVYAAEGSVVFKVFGDGELLFQSGVMTGADAAVRIDVRVRGVLQLRLVVEAAWDGTAGDHGVWANALFQPFSGTFLSDVRWSASSSGWGAIHLDKTHDRNDIRINGVRYGKGVGTHANSEIVVPLGGRYGSFRTYVGVNDDTSGGTLAFRVYADGRMLALAGPMTGADPAAYLEVDVTGVGELRLVVTDAGDNLHSDHAVWALAHLTPLVPEVRISDVSLFEGLGGNRAFAFTVSLSAPAAQAVTVDYATADGTASSPADYVAVPTTTLTFAPGETSKTITVEVNGDALSERPDEFFLVNLERAAGATIADGLAVGTIRDDDPAPLPLPVGVLVGFAGNARVRTAAKRSPRATGCLARTQGQSASPAQT